MIPNINKKPLTICFFSHSNQFNGAEKSLLELIDQLREKNCLCYVVTSAENGPFIDELKLRNIIFKQSNFRWFCQLKKHKINLFFDLAISFISLFGIIKFLIIIKPQIIYTNTKVIPWGAVGAKILRIHHVWHLNEFGYQDHKLITLINEASYQRFIDKSSDLVITNSLFLKKYYQRYIPSKKIKVVYYDINIKSKFIKIDPIKNPYQLKKSLKLIMLASFSANKNQLFALKLVKKLIESDIKVELLLAGAAYDQKYYLLLQNFIKKHQIKNNIHLFPYVLNPYDYMKYADLVLVCSKLEAFSRVAIEALLLKKGLIINTSCGASELLTNQKDAIIYQKDKLDKLVNSLIYLYNEHHQIKKMAEHGYQTVKLKLKPSHYGGEIYYLFRKIINHDQ